MNKLALSGLLAVFFSLNACASKPKDVNPKVDFEKIYTAIQLSTEAIADAQRVTAESENALRSATLTDTQKQKYKAAMSYVPPNMEKPISIFAENDELENAAKLVSLLARYDFNVVNPSKRPRNGVLVSVVSKGRSAFDVIRDIGTQAGELAEVRVRPYGNSDRVTGQSDKFGLIEIEYN